MEKKTKGLRYFKEKTVFVMAFFMFISLWITMVDNVNWSYHDILFEVLGLLIIMLCGMYSNLTNRFPLFHFRMLRMTRERLTSLLIGLLFPISYVIYEAVNDSVIANFIKNISLHNFLSLFFYFMPFVLFVAVLIYYSYIIVQPKKKRCKYRVYEEEQEVVIEKYNTMSINLVLVMALASIWIKLAFNTTWTFDNITTEIIVVLLFLFMRVLGNVRNGLVWYHSDKFKFNKYFILTFLIPYIVILFLFIINTNFRFKLQALGVKYVISYLMYLLPLFVVCSVVVSYIVSELSSINLKITSSKIKKEHVSVSKEKAIRRENILFASALTIIFIQLSLIYIFTCVLDTLYMETLLQLFVLYIPIAVIFYLVFYYSLKEINK